MDRAVRALGVAAHPRSRGENPPTNPGGVEEHGSSPLTRGKLDRSGAHLGSHRLIPAHAGKTLRAGRKPRGHRAHPRSRGENLGNHVNLGQVAGSSPLTRGKLCFIGGKLRCRRLIPAHAGKTVMGRFWRNHAEAHPRSRGENAAISATVARQRGSSPLTRGKLAYRVKTFAQLRLIPAHAGKTRGEHGRCRAAQAHPRSRGENVSPSARRAVARGSSPLTRGKRRLTRSELAHARLIPAHAGKTPASRHQRASGRAHPRSRGENAASTRS